MSERVGRGTRKKEWGGNEDRGEREREHACRGLTGAGMRECRGSQVSRDFSMGVWEATVGVSGNSQEGLSRLKHEGCQGSTYPASVPVRS